MTYLRLGDICIMNPTSPYYADWIGVRLRVVGLRATPEGDVFATVIDGPRRHRGSGAYDGETSDISASWLDRIEPKSEFDPATIARCAEVAEGFCAEEERAASQTSYGERHGHSCAADAAREIAEKIRSL